MRRKSSHVNNGLSFWRADTFLFVAAVVLALVLATLPLRQLVWLYMYIVSGGLLLAAFLLSQEVVEGERARCDIDGSAFWTALLEDRQHSQSQYSQCLDDIVSIVSACVIMDEDKMIVVPASLWMKKG